MSLSLPQIAQIVSDVYSSIEQQNINHLRELSTTASRIEMTPEILRKTKIAKAFQKVRKFANSVNSKELVTISSNLVRDWKDMYYKTPTNLAFATMPLDDFLNLDIELPILTNFLCDPSQRCSPTRIHYLKGNQRLSSGPVVYWMNRDQRLLDNIALIRA